MNDLNGYIKRLDNSMTREEKLFFFDKIDLTEYDIIIDFGCADGRLLFEIDKFLKGKNCNVKYIGIEKNDDIKIAYEFEHEFVRIKSLQDINSEMIGINNALMIFSSVLHECPESDYDCILKFVISKINAVVIRDMNFDFASIGLDRFWSHTVDCVKTILDKNLFFDTKLQYIFLNNGGYSIDNFYEYLLKYEYDENWETEKEERYFNKNLSGFIASLLAHFDCKYIDRYILPYKKWKVKQDFGLDMECNTHIKFIAKRRGNI